MPRDVEEGRYLSPARMTPWASDQSSVDPSLFSSDGHKDADISLDLVGGSKRLSAGSHSSRRSLGFFDDNDTGHVSSADVMFTPSAHESVTRSQFEKETANFFG